jgi:hypothetical protein
MRAYARYEPVDYQPGVPPRVITTPDEEDLADLICCQARLTAESSLDFLEKDDPICRGLDISYCRQQHRRHKCDAPDPQHDGKDGEGSGNRYVIHRVRS